MVRALTAQRKRSFFCQIRLNQSSLFPSISLVLLSDISSSSSALLFCLLGEIFHPSEPSLSNTSPDQTTRVKQLLPPLNSYETWLEEL